MLNDANITEYQIVNRYSTTVEARAELIDQWAENARDNISQEILPQEDIKDDTKRSGHGRISAMRYISVPDLLKCVAHSTNATSLNEFCVEYASAMQRYLDVANRFKKTLITRQCDQISLLRKELAERDAVHRAEQAKLARLATENQEDMKKLIGYAKDTKETLDVVEDELADAKEEVEKALFHLDHKSLTSTQNPVDDKKHHYFVPLLKIINKKKRIVKLISGQKSYVKTQIQKRAPHDFKKYMEPFYQANGIDLRQNAAYEFKKMLQKFVKQENERRRAVIGAANTKLWNEIKEYNEGKTGAERRIFANEFTKIQKLEERDIPIKFNKTSIQYEQNPYFSFEQVLQVLLDINCATQTSPLVPQAL